MYPLNSSNFNQVFCLSLLNIYFQQIWSCPPNSIIPELVHTFSFTHGAILALEVYKGDTIYAGCQDGYVKVLDVETKTLVRTIIVQEVRKSSMGSSLGNSVDISHRASTSFRCVGLARIYTLVPLTDG